MKKRLRKEGNMLGFGRESVNAWKKGDFDGFREKEE
jgi:hypothetical protein